MPIINEMKLIPRCVWLQVETTYMQVRRENTVGLAPIKWGGVYALMRENFRAFDTLHSPLDFSLKKIALCVLN